MAATTQFRIRYVFILSIGKYMYGDKHAALFTCALEMLFTLEKINKCAYWLFPLAVSIILLNFIWEDFQGCMIVTLHWQLTCAFTGKHT